MFEQYKEDVNICRTIFSGEFITITVSYNSDKDDDNCLNCDLDIIQ